MLRARLLAAAVMLPAAILWALLAPLPVFAGVGACLVMAGAWEWAGLCGLGRRAWRIAYVLAMLLLMALAWWGLGHAAGSGFVPVLLWLFLGFWVLTAMELGVVRIPIPRPALALQGMLVLVPAWFSTLIVRSDPAGGRLMMALLVVVWAADAGAYFAGRRWGSRPLARRISPGKTWEGLAGGLGLAVVAGAVASLWCPLSPVQLAVLALPTALASVVGDLTESRLKRVAGAKDSGGLIPGHGGLLDRIDSLTAAAPVFALGLGLVGAGR